MKRMVYIMNGEDETSEARKKGMPTALTAVNRRGSDVSLHTILREPKVHEKFKLYLSNVMSEHLLEFWNDVNNFYDEENIQNKKALALRIYNHYIKEGATNIIDIDSQTRQDIESDLAISGSKIKQKNVKTWQSAFNLAHSKVFHCLQKEHMPRFLLSKQFANVQRDSFHSKAQPPLVNSDSPDDMSMDFIFKNSSGQFFLQNYLFDDGLSAPGTSSSWITSQDKFHLLQQIQDFQSSESTARHRSARAAKIMKRFAKSDISLSSFAAQLAHWESDENGFQEKAFNARELFDQVYNEAMQSLETEHLALFKASKHFVKFKEILAGKVMNPGAQAILQNQQLTTQQQAFTAGKGEEANLMDILGHRLGAMHFRKFCEQHFEEENYLFWAEVTAFKEFADHDQNADHNDNNEHHQAIASRAKIISSKYVEPGSPFEVNLSSDMRGRLLEKVEGNVTIIIFDEALKEIEHLLHINLWQKFKATKQYQAVVAHIKKKATQSEMNAVSKEITRRRSTLKGEKPEDQSDPGPSG